MLLGESGLARLWERVVGYVNEYVETYDSLAVATKRKRGQVRPDGTSITVDEDGTIHAAPRDETFVETDPTVPAWAKAASKPTYTASEVGALPSTTTIPSRTSQLANDSGFITGVPTATSSTAGKVKPDGTTITVDADGTIHGTAQYELPTATESAIGGVKPDGTTITVDADGTIHGSAQVDVATGDSAGIVKPDGTSVTVDPDGTIHAVESSGPHWEVRTVDGTRRLVIVIPEEA